MQTKGAKIGFLVLLIVFGIGAYWFYNHGPFAKMNDEAKKSYQNYVKAEATIISQEGNGRVGKGAAQIWKLQFKDRTGTLHTATLQQDSFMGKDNNSVVNIYYDPENPNAITSEASYDEVMK
ncbi:hypothetical protein [Chryseobacterium luteum]|uniref:DUF3592 domain-containing protein n=1 Tax=Chryseobacterium luteum TaxID=421531 RepID=A0A085ZEC5_9FLAO|nr:hypothetical protein [Chryseobacterium luteum]KFF02789.1 hypothetical protein IX38_12520 [Chryseobacterium luteum]